MTFVRTTEALKAVSRSYYRMARTHGMLSLSLALLAVFIVALSIREGTWAHAVGYLIAISLSAFLTDLYLLWKPTPSIDFIVRNPGKETAFVLGSVLAALALSIVRFGIFTDGEGMSQAIRLALLPLVFLFIYPVFLLISFLLMKYRPGQLGVIGKRIEIAFPIILLLAATSGVVSPDKMQWQAMYREVGVLGLLGMGFLSAAIPEEFVRMLTQTRLGALLNSRAAGWFLAGVFWCVVHVPKFYAQDADLMIALLSALHILPIGLLWGYVTHRTKSMLPAILIHGTNLWGLQNM